MKLFLQRNIWTLSDLSVPKQSTKSYSISSSFNEPVEKMEKNELEDNNKLVTKQSAATLKTETTGDESLFKLYPYFLSTKPSECASGTDIPPENETTSQDSSQSKELAEIVGEYPDSPSVCFQTSHLPESLTNRNTISENPEKLVTQFSRNVSFQLRSKMLKKKCSIGEKSPDKIQNQLEVQEILKSCGNFTDVAREMYFLEILENNRMFAPFFEPSRATFVLTGNIFYTTKSGFV